MRTSHVGMALLAASGSAYAQLGLPMQIGPLHFSESCQKSIFEVFTSGSFASCFRTADLLPLITSPNASIVPVLDNFMTDICGPSDVCSNATLYNASQVILSGCSGDLKNESLSDSVVTTAFGLYPLVRDVLCLKTMNPYTNMSYGGFLGNPPIPVTSSVYNSTNGTFCVTSLLTQLSAYFNHNITVSWIEAALMGKNSTAVQLVKEINPNILCNECIFGAVDLVVEAFPAIANISVVNVTMKLDPNITLNIPQNATLVSLMDKECAYKNYTVTMNGTLPWNITESAQNRTMLNSTLPMGMMNMSMPLNITSPMTMSMPMGMSTSSGSAMPSMTSSA
ncbi:hypothetical protein BD324DRAFT_615906 [Kockovaella imperatae]|uniref:Secreted protein n=1 Tax=Kockovaella imperatae TaxID=4999 RepID=A0A1Y1UR96_9TREE|nr:hypothetical protein BD324DRAFT_615906 [Kockovaella imperatae]ORX40004.1 hypothetical protein BD324DRAFT_615906 [Kockovaella imperatae]